MKCSQCDKEATFDSPDTLCAKHWANWFAANEDGELTPEQEQEWLSEVVAQMKNTVYVITKRDLPSLDGKYTVAANTHGYVAETAEDHSLLEFSLMDGDDIVFPQCRAVSDDYTIDIDQMKKVMGSFDETKS